MLITLVHSNLLKLLFNVIPYKNFRISSFYKLLGFLTGISLSLQALRLCLISWFYSITPFEAQQKLICFGNNNCEDFSAQVELLMKNERILALFTLSGLSGEAPNH